jgi:hypothetical protein
MFKLDGDFCGISQRFPHVPIAAYIKHAANKNALETLAIILSVTASPSKQ